MHKIIIIMKLAFQYHQIEREQQKKKLKLRLERVKRIRERFFLTSPIFHSPFFFFATLSQRWLSFFQFFNIKPGWVWQKKNECCIDWWRRDFLYSSYSLNIYSVFTFYHDIWELAGNFDNFPLNFIYVVCPLWTTWSSIIHSKILEFRGLKF